MRIGKITVLLRKYIKIIICLRHTDIFIILLLFFKHLELTRELINDIKNLLCSLWLLLQAQKGKFLEAQNSSFKLRPIIYCPTYQSITIMIVIRESINKKKPNENKRNTSKIKSNPFCIDKLFLCFD